MTVLLQACAIVAAATALPLAYAFWSAPYGWEDDSGFHLCSGRSVHNGPYTNREVQDHGA